MKIAVASDGLMISPYFEHCTNFNYFCIDNGELTHYRNLPILSCKAENVGTILKDLGVDLIIAGCISERSLNILEGQGFTVFAGAFGEAKKNVEAYITNTYISSDDECTSFDEDAEGDIIWDIARRKNLRDVRLLTTKTQPNEKKGRLGHP